MKRFLLAAVALVAVAATGQTAIAADIPVKAPVMAPVVVPWTWTGFYVGANAGYSWGSADTTVTLPVGPAQLFGTEPSGWLAGGQIGYNWQAGNIVYGIEADLQWTDQRDRVTCIAPICVPNASVRNSLPWFGTLRGRIGF